MKRFAIFITAVAFVAVAGCESPTSSLTTSDIGPDVSALGKGGNNGSSGKSHRKATGEIKFVDGAGNTRYATFNAHEDAPGAQPYRGSLYLDAGLGRTVTVDVDCMFTDGNKAVFSGEVVSGTGEFALGQPRGVGARLVYEAVDGGTAGGNGDTFRAAVEKVVGGRISQHNCVNGSGISPSLDRFAVTEGNLVVH